MKLEDQVCSLELAKKLKEFGVKQNAYWSWYTNAGKGNLMHNPKGYRSMEVKTFDAFSVAEIGEILEGFQLPYFNFGTGWKIKQTREYHRCENEVDARAELLIYLIENKFLTPPIK